MSEYKIEKGIPIPPGYNGERRCKYPFAEMEIGDSVPITGTSSTVVGQSFRHYKPKKFTTRKQENGIRVWRIE